MNKDSWKIYLLIGFIIAAISGFIKGRRTGFQKYKRQQPYVGYETKLVLSTEKKD